MAVIKNIILDWSGTLVDDLRPVVDATNEIFRQYDKPAFTVDEFREKFRLPFIEFYQEYLPEASMVELDHHYHRAFKLLQEDIEPLPHAVDFLEYCQSRDMPLFLLSTIHADHYAFQSERLDFKKYFKQAYVQAMDKRKTILQLLADHNLSAEETMFIGDMQHDIDTAHHGGVMGCGVLTGYDSMKKLKSVQPDLLFADLAGVQAWLEENKAPLDAPPIGTVGALIVNADGKLLMIRTFKWSDLWGIPGGKIKPNEPSLDALHREVKEETNLDLTSVEFVMVQDCIQSTEFYKPAHFLLLNYLARTSQTDVTLNEEAVEYRWVTVDEAYELPLNTPTRILLDECRDQLK